MVYGIAKGNKHSYNDFGLTIKSKKIGSPKKKKINEDVPFMNGSYDFSLLYGEQVYDERILEYKFNIQSENRIELNIKKMEILEWLNTGGKEALYDDAYPGYFFIAEAIDTSYSEGNKDGEISVKFNAYPFMIGKEEGLDIWDEFNFLLDNSLNTSFNVNGEVEIVLVNAGVTKIAPEVICSSSFEIIMNNITYLFEKGTHKDWRFILLKGSNKMLLKGNGNIEFKYRREVF